MLPHMVSSSVIHTRVVLHFSLRPRTSRAPPFFAERDIIETTYCLSNCLEISPLSALILIILICARARACLCVTPCPSRLLLASSSARFPRCVGFLVGRKRGVFLFFGDDGRARLWRRRRQSRRAMMMMMMSSQRRRREEERRDRSTQSRKKRSRTSS